MIVTNKRALILDSRELKGQSMEQRASQLAGFLCGSIAFSWWPPPFGGFDASYKIQTQINSTPKYRPASNQIKMMHMPNNTTFINVNLLWGIVKCNSVVVCKFIIDNNSEHVRNNLILFYSTGQKLNTPLFSPVFKIPKFLQCWIDNFYFIIARKLIKCCV